MKIPDKKVLIWAVLILLAVNLSTIGTIIYNSKYKFKENTNPKTNNIDFPENGLCQFLVDDLKFDTNQKKKYSEYKQEYLSKGKQIISSLQKYRIELMNEMASDKSDTVYLNKISNEIGNYHKELKQATYRFYLDIKSICNEQQKVQLANIFYKMTNNCSKKECSKKYSE